MKEKGESEGKAFFHVLSDPNRILLLKPNRFIGDLYKVWICSWSGVGAVIGGEISRGMYVCRRDFNGMPTSLRFLGLCGYFCINHIVDICMCRIDVNKKIGIICNIFRKMHFINVF